MELLVARHPKVLEVAAVSVASEMSEDEVMVYVVLKPGEHLTPEELRSAAPSFGIARKPGFA